MLIANPIYDVVFKYMMSNIDVAKGLISTIIDEDIVQLDFKAQESVYKSPETLTVYHLDFIAKIRMKEGGYKTILIELQKSNIIYDIMRFRNYVGERYKKVDEVSAADGSVSKEPLPIVTIYFLGFLISKTLPAVIKVDRRYVDVLAGKEIEERNDFIERLTHDSFVIQVPALHMQLKNRLELVLSVFQQEKFIDDKHRIKSYEYDLTDDLQKKILKQLEKAAADKQLLRQLELEEMAAREYENAFGEIKRTLQKKDKTIDQQSKELKNKEKEIEALKKQLQEIQTP